MFKNYLTVTTRYFVKHKLFSAINILCLSIGITFCLIIGAYVMQQQSVNSQLKNVAQQYCLKSEFKQKDLGRDFTTPSPMAKTLKEEYPSLIKNYFRYSPTTNVVSAGDQHFQEDIAISDTTMISMYNFPLLYGDKNRAFTNNNSAVITSTLAMKLFGTKNALGKRISIQTTVNNMPQDYIVSAVLKDIPYNSVTGMMNDQYGVYVPTTGNNYYQLGDPSLGWNTANEISFIELKPGITPQDLTMPLNSLLKKYTSDTLQTKTKCLKTISKQH